jgi:hypothetical protein
MAGNPIGKKDIVFAELTAPILAMITVHYFGFSLGIPLFATLLLLCVGCRFFSVRKQFLLWPLAIQGGHMLWMIGDLYHGFWISALLEISLLAGGLFWLLLRPGGLWPTSLLCSYQAVALLISIVALFYISVDADMHPALFVNIAWRVLAMVSMMLAYYIMSGRAEAWLSASKRGQVSATAQVDAH